MNGFSEEALDKRGCFTGDAPTSTSCRFCVKPFLKGVGGKQRLLSDILQLLPCEGRLIDPFVDAGALFLSGRYHQAVLNDANVDLVAVWTAIKERPAQFCKDASALFTAANHCVDSFLRIRQEFNECVDRYERAVRFIYLNRFGFNGVNRVNSSGVYNVPYDKPPSMPKFPWDQIKAASRMLERAIVLGSDFRLAIELAKLGDVVYCDPPHLPLGETAFTMYTQRGFSVEDHEALVDAAKDAVARGAFVAISGCLFGRLLAQHFPGTSTRECDAAEFEQRLSKLI